MLYWWNRVIVFLCILQRKYCELVEDWWKTWASSDDPKRGYRQLSVHIGEPELMAHLGYTDFGARCSYVYSSRVVWVCLCTGRKSCLPFCQILSACSPLKHADMKDLYSSTLFFRAPWCTCSLPVKKPWLVWQCKRDTGEILKAEPWAFGLWEEMK